MAFFKSDPCKKYKDDVELFIEHLRNDSSFAWECLRGMTYNKAKRLYLMNLINNEDDRYDVYLEALTVFMEKLRTNWEYDNTRGKQGTNSLIFYILGIVKHKAGNYWRRKYQNNEISKEYYQKIKNKEINEDNESFEPIYHEPFEEEQNHEDLYVEVGDCMKKTQLSFFQREVIVRMYFENQSYAEIADALKSSVPSIRQQVYSGLKRVRDCMKQKGLL